MQPSIDMARANIFMTSHQPARTLRLHFSGTDSLRASCSSDSLCTVTDDMLLDVVLFANARVLQLKKLVQDAAGIPVMQQEIFLNSQGLPLRSCDTLLACGVCSADDVTIVVKPVQAMRIWHLFVKDVTGKTMTIEAEPTSIVYELKYAVQTRTGIPVDQQRLIYSGRQLQDAQSLCSHGLTKECTVHVVLRLSGD